MESASTHELHVVTGAFGFSGKYIARRLLDAGHLVRTLTNSMGRRNPFGSAVEVRPLDFEHEDRLAEGLRGAKVLYNTYWVRFNYADFQRTTAVENTLTLFRAAKKAGVSRVVHVSITNPSEDSKLEYFRGKAQLERALIESGLSYSILRPAVLFGREDILINNIAWTLRKFPVFFIFGNGKYHLQPIYVDDLAKLAVEQGRCDENKVVNAIGPETFTYRQLVRTLAGILGKRRLFVSVPPGIGYLGGSVIGWFLRDKMFTREEIEGLMADLLHVDAPAAGETKLTDWARQHADQLGMRYASEMARRRNRSEAYERL
ncbi:MAG: NAD(P)H-binding protein [Thermoguttaceae bacterium]|jgi:NADH dehydrogenase